MQPVPAPRISDLRHTRTLLAVDAAAFWTAALVHAGVLTEGYQHHAATVAESVIGGVLTLGLIATVLPGVPSRAIALAAQGFALLGTLVGLVTIVVGVGPQSRFDVALHLGFVTLLIAGLVIVARHPAAPRRGGSMSGSRQPANSGGQQ